MVQKIKCLSRMSGVLLGNVVGVELALLIYQISFQNFSSVIEAGKQFGGVME